jgi:alpha-tubulin suppressor-like RCC1 family protein
LNYKKKNKKLISKDCGKLFSVGFCGYGELGIGKFVDCETNIRQINFPKNTFIENVFTGYGHSIAISKDGLLYGWYYF